MQKILIIQTAFIGDVVLATALVEKLHRFFPKSNIDFLLRKGNENLLKNHPIINQVLIWDKTNHKYQNWFQVLKTVRDTKYDVVINLQRFASTGILTILSGAKKTVGFNKNPFSFGFSIKVKHQIKKGIHEVDRNLKLIESFTNHQPENPILYPSEIDLKNIKLYQNQPYVCIAPSSVWFTKQFPKEKWIELIQKIPKEISIYLLGSKSDFGFINDIIQQANQSNVQNLAGKLTFLESAALMKNAEMNYCNDSAPLHFASAVNAKSTAIFCSTIPEFGFGPLSDDAAIWQVDENLPCRPCGLHGKKFCPEGHFKCGYQIPIPDKLF